MLVFVTIQAYMLLLFISLAAACFRTDFNMKLSFVQCMDSIAVPIIMLQLSCAVCLVHTTSMMTAYKEVMKRKKMQIAGARASVYKIGNVESAGCACIHNVY